MTKKEALDIATHAILFVLEEFEVSASPPDSESLKNRMIGASEWQIREAEEKIRAMYILED